MLEFADSLCLIRCLALQIRDACPGRIATCRAHPHHAGRSPSTTTGHTGHTDAIGSAHAHRHAAHHLWHTGSRTHRAAADHPAHATGKWILPAGWKILSKDVPHSAVLANQFENLLKHFPFRLNLQCAAAHVEPERIRKSPLDCREQLTRCRTIQRHDGNVIGPCQIAEQLLFFFVFVVVPVAIFTFMFLARFGVVPIFRIEIPQPAFQE